MRLARLSAWPSKKARGAAANTEFEDRNKGTENRHHDHDGTVGPRKSPVFLSLWRFEQGQVSEAAEREAKFQADVLAVRQLRANMKNPASFNLDTAIRLDDGTLCLSYRDTNSFNAIVPGRAIITKQRLFRPTTTTVLFLFGTGAAQTRSA